MVGSNDERVMAVLRKFVELERQLFQISELADDTVTGPTLERAVWVLKRRARVRPRLTAKFFVTLRDIWSIRNSVLHGADLPENELRRVVSVLDGCLAQVTDLAMLLELPKVQSDKGADSSLSAIASEDVVTRLAIESRHYEPAPRFWVGYVIMEDTRTRKRQLWAVLKNESNRAYEMTMEMQWGDHGVEDPRRMHVDPLTPARVFLTENVDNPPVRLVFRFKAGEWDYGCPCSRPDDFGHWSQDRTVSREALAEALDSDAPTEIARGMASVRSRPGS